MTANPCKPSVYLECETWDEIDAIAARYEASRSWVVQQAWKLAREEIAAFPSAPSKRAAQAPPSAPKLTSQALSKPAPSQALSRPASPPAWEVCLRYNDPLDSQARERLRWSDGDVGEPTL